MFNSFYNVLRSEIGKAQLSYFNVFTYSNIFIFKCNVLRLLSFFKSNGQYLFTSVVNLNLN